MSSSPDKPTDKDTSSKKYQLTINNYEEKGLDYETIRRILSELKSVQYYCLSKEIGLENKTPHIHLFIYFSAPVRFSTLKRRFPQAHIEAARGTCVENKAYIEKSGKWAKDAKSDTSISGTFFEHGVMPQELGQGFRSDVALVYDLIKQGWSNSQIMDFNPNLAQFIGKMDKIRLDILEEKYKTTFRELNVCYIFGETETGKTRYVLDKHGYKNVFRVYNYLHPFDTYKQEPVLFFDEFRSSLPIGDMLSYLDGYPLSLPARYANHAACYTAVFLASNIDLREQYKNVQEYEPATWKAFLRRIHSVIEFSSKDSIIELGSGLQYVFPEEFTKQQYKTISDNSEPDNSEELDLPF